MKIKHPNYLVFYFQWRGSSGEESQVSGELPGWGREQVAG